MKKFETILLAAAYLAVVSASAVSRAEAAGNGSVMFASASVPEGNNNPVFAAAEGNHNPAWA